MRSSQRRGIIAAAVAWTLLPTRFTKPTPPVPRLTLTGTAHDGTYDVAEGTRLTTAIEAQGVDIGHRCGGKARCTTCRVTFTSGEPETFTRAEYDKLKERNLLGEARLSCQILCDHDMTVGVGMTVESMGWSDPGPDLADAIEPEAERLERSALES
jgi:ferredoxin